MRWLLLLLLCVGCAERSVVDFSARVEPIDHPVAFDLLQQRYAQKYRLELKDPDDRLANVEIEPLFPATYRPTWAEVLSGIGREVELDWHPSGMRGVVFTGDLDPAFEMELGPMVRRVNGNITTYTRKGLGVVIYVHQLGDISGTEQTRGAARLSNALRLAKSADSKVTAADLTAAHLAGYDAIYFETINPETKSAWRQWSIVENGKAFVVVVAQQQPESIDLPDAIAAMLDSFTVR